LAAAAVVALQLARQIHFKRPPAAVQGAIRANLQLRLKLALRSRSRSVLAVQALSGMLLLVRAVLVATQAWGRCALPEVPQQ
jgi:hypothetical protein